MFEKFDGAGHLQRAPKMTISEKGAALKKLVEEGWLAVPPEQTGRYSIGVRALVKGSKS